MAPCSEDHHDKHTKPHYQHHTNLLFQNENSETTRPERVSPTIAACSPDLHGAGQQSSMLTGRSAPHKRWGHSRIKGTHVQMCLPRDFLACCRSKAKYKPIPPTNETPSACVRERPAWKYIWLSITSLECCPGLPTSLQKGSSSQTRCREGNQTWRQVPKTHKKAAQSSLDLNFSYRLAWLYFP